MITPANSKYLRFIPKSLLQQPFELLLGIMCLFAGIPYVFGNAPTSQIDSQLPHLLIKVWGGTLTFGGFLLVFGILKYSSYIERAGLSLLGPSALVYALLLITYIGMPAIFSSCIVIAFGIACILKEYTIKVATLSIARIFREERESGR